MNSTTKSTKSSLKPLIYLIAALSFSTVAWGNNSVPECRTRPEFFSHGKALASVKALPHMVLVGQRAIYYIENRSTGFRLWGEQSFVKGQSKIVCSSVKDSKENEDQSFSIYAPTLIDLRGDQNIGDSYWQFHMIANSKQFGIWNQKSRLFSKSKDLDEGLSKIGAQVQVFQLSKDQYELQFSRASEKGIEILSIRFDAIADVP